MTTETSSRINFDADKSNQNESKVLDIIDELRSFQYSLIQEFGALKKDLPPVDSVTIKKISIEEYKDLQKKLTDLLTERLIETDKSTDEINEKRNIQNLYDRAEEIIRSLVNAEID